MSMRYLESPITYIRSEVFKAIAKAAFDDWSATQIQQIPHIIISSDTPVYRESVTREREIVSQRVRLALGLDLWDIDRQSGYPDTFNLDRLKEHRLPTQAIRVIPEACEACEEKSYFVSNTCHGCLAHPCIAVCPVSATSIQNGLSFIDQQACIKCGKCYDVCPYDAIVKNERPCVAACGANAITKDDQNRAVIVSENCVACGMCMVNCPFGAIADKSEVYQVVAAAKDTKQSISAIVAPSFAGQFGPKVTYSHVKKALHAIGFDHVLEVALGADITAVKEAQEYVHEVVEGDYPFLATSCCPAWSKFAKRELKELSHCISESHSPMIETAKVIRKEKPEELICFIGPCSAKKQEVAEPQMAGWIDYVLTYEEVKAIFEAKELTLDVESSSQMHDDGSHDGRYFGVSGGVLAAVGNVLQQTNPELEIPTDRAEGLHDCKKMLLLAKFGKREQFLLEGMACPGGCVGGAGTLINQNKAATSSKQFAQKSTKADAFETFHEHYGQK